MDLQATLAVLQAHFNRSPDFAVEKALRGETLTTFEMTKGTRGIPTSAFVFLGDDAWRLTDEALKLVGAAA